MVYSFGAEESADFHQQFLLKVEEDIDKVESFYIFMVDQFEQHLNACQLEYWDAASRLSS